MADRPQSTLQGRAPVTPSLQHSYLPLPPDSALRADGPLAPRGFQAPLFSLAHGSASPGPNKSQPASTATSLVTASCLCLPDTAKYPTTVPGSALLQSGEGDPHSFFTDVESSIQRRRGLIFLKSMQPARGKARIRGRQAPHHPSMSLGPSHLQHQDSSSRLRPPPGPKRQGGLWHLRCSVSRMEIVLSPWASCFLRHNSHHITPLLKCLTGCLS